MNHSPHVSPNLEPRGPSLRQTHSSHDTNTSTQPSTPRRSHSERVHHYRPTMQSTFNSHDLPPLPHSDMSSEARRQSIMAMDRKRRLTASAQETGRRRTTTGGFTSRDNRYYHTAQRRNSQLSSGSASGPSNEVLAPREVIDLTSSSPPQPSTTASSAIPPSRPPRTSSNSSRGYVIPRWQPDAEVSECPICHRQFGFLFRRHHCRKCGRVVCNDCSPHRITIPRQYIVHSPGTLDDPQSPSNIPTIDLTRGGDEDESYGRLSGSFQRSNAALGGGEKVRLCNPCVPDPQPELQALLPDTPQSHSQVEGQHQPQSAASGLLSFPDFLQQSAQQDFIRDDSATDRFHARVPHPDTRAHVAMGEVGEDDDGSGSSPEAYTAAPRRRIMELSQNRYHPAMPPALHSRYHSLDHRHQAPLPPLPPLPPFHNRPRIVSMLDPPRNYYGGSGVSHQNFQYGTLPRPQDLTRSPQPPSSSHQPQPQPSRPRPSRPRIREEDICPICRRELPPKGPSGDETDRENHIMECISQHDTSSTPASRSRIPTTNAESSSSSTTFSRSLPASANILTQTFGASGPTIPMSSSSSSATTSRAIPPPTQMLRFTATEKDCGPGEGGDVQECSICMVEYEVGDRLVRLECWCKFHEECIVEWFGRKAECPVHKVS